MIRAVQRRVGEGAGRWRREPIRSALILILIQTGIGLWLMPRLNFFPVYLQDMLSLSPQVIGLVVSGGQVAGMVAALMGGALTGRLGSKGLLVGGLICSAISSLLYQTVDLWLVSFLWMMGGAGVAMITVGGSSYLTGLSVKGSLGMLAAVYALSLTVGGSLSNPLVGWLIEGYGYVAFGVIELLLISLITLLAALIMRSQRGHGEEAPRSSFLSETLPIVRRVRVRHLLGMRALPTIFYGAVLVLVPLLLNDLTGSKALVAAYGTASLVLASVAQLLAGKAADRWGAKGPTLVGYAILMLSGLGLGLMAHSPGGIVVFGVLAISAAWALAALMYVWVADGLPQAEHPAGFGILHAVWSLSMIIGPILGGWLLRLDAALPFLLIGLLNLASLWLTLAFYRRVEG